MFNGRKVPAPEMFSFAKVLEGISRE